MKSAPQLAELYDTQISDNPKVEFIHISMDKTNAAAIAWAQKASLPWPTVLPEDAGGKGLKALFPKEGVPEYMLFDASGKELITADYDLVFAQLEKLLKT